MEISKILLWSGFSIFVLGMLLLDLLVFHRKSHEVKLKEALLWSAVWISLALVFNVGIYIWQGKQPALEFLTGYLIEKSLSVDNIFVFLMLFSYFKVPPRYQHQVLFWGILGALLMRAGFIAGGITLIKHFHWIIYVFGGFLVFTGIKMAMEKDKEIHPEKSLVLRLFHKIMPVRLGYEDNKFFVKKDGRTFATHLFIVLLVVETTDVIFAVDSIHIECFCHLGIASSLFRVVGDHASLSLSPLRAFSDPRFCWRQNVDGRYFKGPDWFVLGCCCSASFSVGRSVHSLAA